MANEMGIDQKDLEALISQIASTSEDLDKKTKIKILGFGGEGISALNEISKNKNIVNLITSEYIDSDADSLKGIQSSSKLLIGEDSVAGLGAHGNPQYGLAAIKESEKLLQEKINEEDILFVLAGMGGGTGGGASPLIGRIAKEKNILSIAIVSTPTAFEGRRRMKQAEESIKKLHKIFDLIVTIPFSRNDNSTPGEVFNYTNELMSDTVVDLVRVSEQNDNFLNSNFDDIRSLLKDSGKGIVGIGSGSGRNKALEAAVAAINSSLLQNSEQLGSVKIDQAKGCLLIVKGDKDMTIEDVTSAAEVIGDSINQEADIMVRTVLDESMKGEIKVMVLLTKFSETSPKGKNLTNKDNLKNRIVGSKKYIDDRAVG